MYTSSNARIYACIYYNVCILIVYCLCDGIFITVVMCTNNNE